ncbi:MAG: PqqD family protein [Gammaproteobacteria bacterium]|nr:PqqD family protein [Gammaproteobacteria bacterium]
MPIPLSSSISISSEVLAQEVDNETVLLDLQSESYFGLDEVGTRIWQLLQEHKQLQKVFDILLEEYDVDAKQLENDLNELLEKLLDANLINVEPIAE